MKSPKIDVLVKLYYEQVTLSNKDIKLLFGLSSDTSVSKYKRMVIEHYAETDVNPISRLNGQLKLVEAFRAWEIDIKDIESRYRKAQKNAAHGTAIP